MTFDHIIDEVIPTARSRGLDALSLVDRRAFLIFEAHAACAIDGIESFIQRYSKPLVQECAAAFRIAGQLKVAEGLAAIAETWPHTPEPILAGTNDALANYAALELLRIT